MYLLRRILEASVIILLFAYSADFAAIVAVRFPSIGVPLNIVFFAMVLLFAVVIGYAHGRPNCIEFYVAGVSFIVIYAISGFLSPLSYDDLYAIIQNIGKITIVIVGIPFLVGAVYKDARYPRFAVVGGVFFGSILILYEVVTGYRFAEGGDMGYYTRPAAFWINSNSAGVALGLGIISTLFYAGRHHVVINIVRAAMLAALFATASRGAVLACFLGLTYFFVRRYGKNAVLPVTSLVALMIIVPAIGLQLDLIDEANYEKMDFFKALFTLNLSEMSDSETRSEIWIAGLEKIFDSPIFGSGHNSFEGTLLGLYSPHNTFIQITGNSGIVSLAAFLVFISVMWLYISRNCVNGVDIIVARAFLVSLLVSGFFEGHIMHNAATAALLAAAFFPMIQFRRDLEGNLNALQGEADGARWRY